MIRPVVFSILTGILAATALAGEPIDYSAIKANSWQQISPRAGAAIPKWQWEGSADLDPQNDQWIHHGGHDGGPQGFATFTMNMATGKWQQVFPNTAPPGVCCVDGSNVFDPANRVFVRFPGGSLGHGWQWSRSVRMRDSHVWLYHPDKSRWVNMRPPPYDEPQKYSREVLGILNSSGTYDPVHEVALSFGGQSTGGGTDVLHAYDAYSNTLTKMDAAGAPERRDGSGVAYDAANDCLVMFGSQYNNDEKTWIYRFDTNAWVGHDLTPHPPGAKGKNTYATIPKMTWDPLNKVMICVVWLNGPHETWALDVGKLKWTKMDPPAEAPDSRSRTRNIGYDRKRGLVLLEIENYKLNSQPELWAYRYATPAQRPFHFDYGLSAVTGERQVSLTWKSPDVAGGQDVYRGEGEHSFKVKLEKVASGQKGDYVDSAVEPGKTYFYRVKTPAAKGEVIGSNLARSAPRVALEPVVSVQAVDRVEVSWGKHPAGDVVGYNVYRALATVQTVIAGKKGQWGNNDPNYGEPTPVRVRSLGQMTRLNEKLLTGTSFADTKVNLGDPGEESAGYKFKVYAYVVRAVNKLGAESGPSPYSLTLPSLPRDVMLREVAGGAEIKWSANPEQAIAGYNVYMLPAQYSLAERLNDKPIAATSFQHNHGSRARYFVTAVDKLGQEGEPSAPVWFVHRYTGFYEGEWHQ